MRNVIVIGLAHSGVSLVTRLIRDCGWHLGDVNDKYEHPQIVECNNKILDGRIDIGSMILSLASIPKPCVIKDYRFVFTYHHWHELLTEYVMVYVIRDNIDIWRSNHKYHKYVSIRLIQEDSKTAAYRYDTHIGPKMAVDGQALLNSKSHDIFKDALIELVNV
jgi:hypothetical protein